MIHKKERGVDSQQHLDQNLAKFSGDCLTVMKLLFSGKRLTARELERIYDIDGRRLRDVIKASPNMVKKQKVTTKDGSRSRFVEYFIPVFKKPTKKSLTKK